VIFYFFFSSRRRHTRSKRDWSSDVCSSDLVDDITLLPTATHQIEVYAKETGFVSEIIADKIGIAAMHLGAGRVTKDSVIDLAVGIELHKKIGDRVEIGDTLVTIHSNTESIDEVEELVDEAYRISNEDVEKPILIYTEID